MTAAGDPDEAEQLAGRLVDDLDLMPNRPQRVEYLAAAMSALVNAHADGDPVASPEWANKVFWFDRGILAAFHWLVADGARLTAADMLNTLIPSQKDHTQ